MSAGARPGDTIRSGHLPMRMLRRVVGSWSSGPFVSAEARQVDWRVTVCKVEGALLLLVKF